MSAVSWASATGGSWSTPANWSNDAVPTGSDTVTINQPGNIQVTLTGTASISSLTLAGDSLQITSGTLTVASGSNIGAGGTVSLTTATVNLASGAGLVNSGDISVNPGSALNVGGGYTETLTGNLTLPSTTTLSTNVGTDLLSNSGFESPAAGTNTTTAPNGYGVWGASYVSTTFAHSDAQSLQQSGANSGVNDTVPVTPGVSYTASAYAMTPSTSKLTGPEGAFLNFFFYNASGTQIGSKSVTVLNSNSAAGGPIAGTVGAQGWNYFTSTAVAPSNAATATVAFQAGAYTGISGTAGGTVYWDDAQFGPTAPVAAVVTAANILSGSTISIGAGDSVTTTGTFSQTSSGTLAIQLGGPPAGLFYGVLTSGGTASIDGTLSVTLANGYTPSVGDNFSLLTYPSETGTFATVQLPTSSSYTLVSSVNPTYTSVAALPTALLTTVNAGAVVGAASTNVLGVNLAFWDDKLTTAQTQSLVQAAGLDTFRFPGGSSSDDFHFNVAANYSDAAANNIPQFAEFIASVGGTGVVTLDYGSGSPQEAEAELAYLNGSPTDTTSIGTGIEWNDSISQWQNVNWQTVGYWASLRAASALGTDDGLNFLRISHAAPFTGINYWEVGNEEYGSWEIDHHGTAGPGGVSTGAQHDPATYASFAASFASFVASDQSNLPAIQIGIDSEDPTGASDNNWTKNVVTDLFANGFEPGFISDHSYMQGPGSESDSFLLNDTVSDPASLFDWSTRYADYKTMLNSVLGSNASSVNVMATEFNSVYGNPGKQSTSLVNALFIADSIGSLLDSGYGGGYVWDLRNGWDTTQNNSPTLYGWREGGDYGLLGDPNNNLPPSTGPYVAYPNYYAEQLASKIVQAGGKAVSTISNYSELATYGMIEPNGHLDLLVINKNPDATITEPFNVAGFTPSGRAQIWQYGEAQDYAQSQSPTGASSLASFSTNLSLTGNNFSYTFSPYSMTVIDLTPAVVPVASTFQVNDGSPQRAMVTSLTVTFNEEVNLASNAITLNLLSQTGGASTPVAFVLNSQNAGSTWVLTFNGSGDIGGSLPDGGYELTVNASGVTSTQGVAMAASQNFTFWRLYGDFAGTGAVNGSDFSKLAAVFGSTTNSSDWYIDFNNDGVINGSDFGAFAARFGSSISIPAVTAVLQTSISSQEMETTSTPASTAVVLAQSTAPTGHIQKKSIRQHHAHNR
jgi:hypothetical protein